MKLNKILYITLIFVLSFSLITGAQEPVKITQPQREDIAVTELLSGKVIPEKTVNLPAEINGIVDKLHVSVGDKVNKGDKILEFDKSQLLIQKKQSEASLEAAQANLDQLQKGASEEDIQSAEANYEQAQISLESAKENLELIKEIYNDKTNLRQQLVNAESQFKNAEKQLESAEERVNQAKKSLEQAEVGVRQAENNLNQAKNDYERMQQLYEDNVISEKELEGAKLQLENARSSYENAQLQVDNARVSIESARIAKEQAELSLNTSEKMYEIAKENYNNPTQLKQQLQSAKNQVNVSEVNKKIAKINVDKVKKGADADQIRASKANVKQAEAGLERVEDQLSKAVITSPISAHIATVNTEENEMISQGTPVVRLAVTDTLNINTTVTSELRPLIEKGDTVDILVKNGKTRIFEGKIKTISPVIDPQNEAYPVVIEFTGDPQNVYPGMFVDVRISKDRAREALTLPVDAVLDLDTFPYVYVVEDGKVVKNNVEIGIIFDDIVEVKSGLAEDDQVIIQGQKRVQEGQSVEVIE
ncbi:MAG: efflux RND transporter periplasmic adaptor subunit [Halanaerobiales bacterium]|nr:efflux RND transporter periplasmic adaptor subunit [Halanaerobiales bacterium]